ncbi:hypothetical protein [Streptomyces sp. GESEQ-35]|uniref:hypothetical protein n=1 Tax=Streptomyces sp. GESEQ-35 TaxID=2812657 RepID=UPI001B32AA2A|nr:hypothetical protein [Streptomyces sp. GESEQ-35]
MGYWGYLVVGRSERPLDELAALSGAQGMSLRASAPGGWQVWEYPSGDGDIGSMNALAEESGAPALFGYVMDSACAVVEAAGPQSGAWSTCLARAAMAGYLGADKEGLTLEDYFLEPRDAAERAVAWAAEAGHEVSDGPLLDVLTADADPLAENLFFRMLDRLGVVPL